MAVGETLTNADFGPGDDFVAGELTNSSDSEQIGVQQDDDLVEAQAGDDTIIGEIDDANVSSDLSTLIGVRINGTLLLEEGNDSLIGDVDADIDGANATTLIGIQDTVEKTINAGDGDDEIVGTAFATVANGDNTTARGILGGTIIMGAGLDSVAGSATIVAGENTTDNSASGIERSYINTGIGQDDVQGDAALLGGNDDVSGTATGIDHGYIETFGGDDAVTGTATVAVGDDTATGGSAVVSASGIYGAQIHTGEGGDDVTGHADISTGDGYGIFDSHGIYLEGLYSEVTIAVIEEPGATITTGADADRVVGRVDIDTGNDSSIEYVTGIGSGNGGPAIDTGAGNDDVTGLVEISGGEDTSVAGVFGIYDMVIDADGDDDTVVGGVVAALGAGSTLSDSAGISGPTAQTIECGTGDDIAVGVLLAPGAGANPRLSADEIQTIVDVTTPDQVRAAAYDLASDFVVDPRNSAAVPDAGAALVDFASGALGTGADALSIIDVAGIREEVVLSGTGTDLVVGAVATAVGDDNGGTANITNANGIVGSLILTGGEGGPYEEDSAADYVAGLTMNTGGEGAALENNDGIDGSGISVDRGDAVVAGLSVNAVGAGGTASHNSGISRVGIDADSPGDKRIFGVSVTEGASGSVHEDNNGIENSDIETGRDNDMIVGASIVSSDSGDVEAAWGTGILGVDDVIATNEGDDTVFGIGANVAIGTGAQSFGIARYDVDLGAGDDLIFARGATAGVSQVDLFGKAGDDTFDVHSGTGLIDGGEDLEDTGDTLVLAGTEDNWNFSGNGDLFVVDDDNDVPETLLTVVDVEFIRFLGSGETVETSELEDLMV